MKDPRACAARALAPILRQRGSLSATLSEGRNVEGRDRALFQELCFGAARWAPRLLPMLDSLLAKPLKAEDADIRALLLIGAYQLEYTRVPPHAALSATVDATRLLGKSWASKFVNAILRRFQRERDSLEASLKPWQRAGYPEWLYQRIRQAWPDQAEAALAAGNAHPPLWLRSNTLKTRRQDYLAQLAEAGIAAEAGPAPHSIRLEKPMDVAELPGFAEGWLSVQDLSAQWSAELLEIADGERVLDACCAPGGKLCHLLEQAPGARLVGVELEQARLGRVRDNLQRLGLSAELLCADATAVDSWWDGEAFDRILIDAPCSATGVLRRHPDIKLLRRQADIAPLAALQGQMLRALWATLKPGGTLVYATCSLLPEENEQVVQAFLVDTPAARADTPPLAGGFSSGAGVQFLPSEQGGDGFYYCRLRKA